MMVMILPSTLITDKSPRYLDRYQPVVFDERLDVAVDGGDADAGAELGRSLQNLRYREGSADFAYDSHNGAALLSIAFQDSADFLPLIAIDAASGAPTIILDCQESGESSIAE